MADPIASTIKTPMVAIDVVAKYFMVSISTVRSWLRAGLIPPECYIRIGHTFRFDIDKVADALTKLPKDRESPTAPPPPANPEQFDLPLPKADVDL